MEIMKRVEKIEIEGLGSTKETGKLTKPNMALKHAIWMDVLNQTKKGKDLKQILDYIRAQYEEYHLERYKAGVVEECVEEYYTAVKTLAV